MNVVAALCATTILGALAVFQLALAFGAPAGRFAWGGRHRVLPTGLRVGSGLSILLYAGLAAVLLARAAPSPCPATRHRSSPPPGRCSDTSSSACS
ncbi:hypothetical protein [Leucobacter soli]|uniref:hypothetical protein n=1 Tax=Leucobacter soli TaxID=2812850 RepID=UPI00360FF967